MTQIPRKLMPLGTVYLSKSRCIYENLAFEEWLFRHHDLQQNGEALLLWSNTPTVVVGRHQNPFLEANLRFCHENSIHIARRHSGGGAVYHDQGNLNISLLTAQSRHCRRRNLRLLADSLNASYGGVASVDTNERDDLVFEQSGCKISGTAARISHGRAYHHLTLLIDVPLHVLKSSLDSNLKGKVHTNATRSVKAKSVGFLRQRLPDVEVGEVRRIVADAFASQFAATTVVEWTSPTTAEARQRRLHQPTSDGEHNKGDASFDGNWRLLRSEEWIFGRTPAFDLTIFGSSRADAFHIVVEKGRIKQSLHREFPVGTSFYQSFRNSKYF